MDWRDTSCAPGNGVELLLVVRHSRCHIFKLYPNGGGFNSRHLQRAMTGNVTLYEVNTSAVADMLEGAFYRRWWLHSVAYSVTFIGTKTLPKDCYIERFRCGGKLSMMRCNGYKWTTLGPSEREEPKISFLGVQCSQLHWTPRKETGTYVQSHHP